MPARIDLLEDFRSIVAALDRDAVDYAVVGALALAVHGFPRATTDIDLLVQPADLDRALGAIEPLGYRFRAEPMRFRSGISVQRVTRVEGSEHLMVGFLLVGERLHAAWDSRTRIASEEGSIVVISREALVAMKALAGRPQDLVDLQRLDEPEDGPSHG
jgi:hypothetical protein